MGKVTVRWWAAWFVVAAAAVCSGPVTERIESGEQPELVPRTGNPHGITKIDPRGTGGAEPMLPDVLDDRWWTVAKALSGWEDRVTSSGRNSLPAFAPPWLLPSYRATDPPAHPCDNAPRKEDFRVEEGPLSHEVNQPAFVSDDFHAPALNTDLWTFVDPLGDSALCVTGAQIEISVPAGTKHGLGTAGIRAPRIMQPAENIDFGVEAKFESIITQQFQTQGVVIQESANAFMRVEFFKSDTATNLYVATYSGGSSTLRIFNPIPDGIPLFLRVSRSGMTTWTVRYSYNGTSWTTAGSFTHSMTVQEVGAYGGNDALTGDTPPAHKMVLDYFFSTAAPIVPEDSGEYTLTWTAFGPGSVACNPDQGSHTSGSSVQVSAIPEPGYALGSWDGDLTGSANPRVLTMTRDLIFQAYFIVAPTPTPGPSPTWTPTPTLSTGLRLETWEAYR